MVLISVAFIAAMRWIILPRVVEGRYSIFSFFYLRKWTVALATEITLEVLSSLFATVYMRAWYRLMGPRSARTPKSPPTCRAATTSSRSARSASSPTRSCWATRRCARAGCGSPRVKTGARVFVGNDAVVPIGSEIPEGALIGIKSKPPENAAMKPATPGSARRRSACRCASASTAAGPTGPTRRRAGRRSCAPCSRPCTSPCPPCCSSSSAPGRCSGSAPRSSTATMSRWRCSSCCCRC